MEERLGRCTFGVARQSWFAAASGDHNPIHVDPVQARRAMYGQPVVHGIHLVLSALELWCRSCGLTPVGMSAMFAKPVFIDESVEVINEQQANGSCRIRLRVSGTNVATIRVRYATSAVAPDRAADPARAQPGTDQSPTLPVDLEIEDLHHLSGEVQTPAHRDHWADSFPCLGEAIGGAAIAELAALSTIVGMRCPGKHSVFGSFDVHLHTEATTSGVPLVRFAVNRVEETMSAVKLAVAGSRLAGTVSAFVRPRPMVQPSGREVCAVVEPGQFSNIRALIVGGSRGLGEVTAKIIAAGGGHVVLTWKQGEADARAVAADIVDNGGSVEVVHLDTAAPVVADHTGDGITDLFYFASPRITARRLSGFDHSVFEGFLEVYVTGFLQVADAVYGARATPLRVLYPSTAFIAHNAAQNTAQNVTQNPAQNPAQYVEYSSAKAAGEVAARAWGQTRPGTTVMIPRLPPLPTDQTTSRSDHDNFADTDIVSTMYQLVVEMAARSELVT